MRAWARRVSLARLAQRLGHRRRALALRLRRLPPLALRRLRRRHVHKVIYLLSTHIVRRAGVSALVIYLHIPIYRRNQERMAEAVRELNSLLKPKEPSTNTRTHPDGRGHGQTRARTKAHCTIHTRARSKKSEGERERGGDGG